VTAPDPSPGEESPRASAPAPHDRPTVDELLQAVEEFLRQFDPDGDGQGRRFTLRVAANALSIVRRQLALGERHAEAHAARLARLGVGDDAGLAAAIRSGSLDDRADEVLEVVREAVADKLAVANPRYADPALSGGEDGG
jgi:hypothetical protein